MKLRKRKKSVRKALRSFSTLAQFQPKVGSLYWGYPNPFGYTDGFKCKVIDSSSVILQDGSVRTFWDVYLPQKIQ
jgi:hypothetical protein